MRRIVMLGVVGVSLALAGAGGTGSAPPPPSLLTYAVLDDRGGICLTALDGSPRVRLTRGARDRSPSWSPDGRHVAFARQLEDPLRIRIVVADTLGRVVRSFGSGTASTDPAWSPDGRRIAYATADALSRIVVASAAGRKLAELPGSRVASVSTPAWSPDGRQIAYTEHLESDALPEGQPSTVVVVDADGSGRRVLARNAAAPTWSPDGSKIAYVAFRSRWTETGQVVVADADGSGPRRLTAAKAPESQPAWSPDGRLIAFARGAEDSSTIVIGRPDGSNQRVVVRSGSYAAADPAWRPPVAFPKGTRAACP